MKVESQVCFSRFIQGIDLGIEAAAISLACVAVQLLERSWISLE
jgi:hypothetical protein